jgi:hypothetical protein
MAMFVQLLGDEATWRDTHWDRNPRCRNESLNQEEEYMTFGIPQIILALASSALLVINFPPANQSRDSA